MGVPETRVSLRSRCTLVGCARIADVSLTRVQLIKTLLKPYCETLLKLRLIKPYFAAKTLQSNLGGTLLIVGCGTSVEVVPLVRTATPVLPRRGQGPSV